MRKPDHASPPSHPLVRFAVERRVTMGMLLVGLVVLGSLALQRLPLEFLPAISSSNISVSGAYASASPEEIERRIVRPLEDSFGTLNGLDRLSAQAASETYRLDLTFLDGADMDLAAVEVRDRIDRVRHLLPDDLRNVRVRRFQSSDLPVLRFHLSADWDSDRLYGFAERVVQRRLERLEGVAQVDVRGLRRREVQVRLDPHRMAAHGVDAGDLAARLRRNHLNIPGGTLDEDGRRKLLVRSLGELRSLEEVRELPIGSGLRLADVAEVAYDFPKRETYDFLNGVEALTVQVYKASSANLLAVVDRAKAELEALEVEPQSAGLAMRVYHDASIDVRRGLGQLRDAGLVGGLLAVIAVFVFLRRLRSTLIVALAIPVSVVFTFVLMFLIRQLFGVELSLNVVSLMGLVLALGMLVDSSIVVLDSIFRHSEELGEEPGTAALRGASEVALPILASTATTLCVFIPVIFLSNRGGFFSRYLTEIGTTVCIVMVASLLVALTVVPMAAALLLGRASSRATPFLDGLRSSYGSVLDFSLRHRLVFFTLSAALLWGSWEIFGTIERTFSSRTMERQVKIHVDTPRSYSAEQVRDLFEEVVAPLDARREELDIADIAHRYFVGGGRARGRSRQRSIDVFLVDEDEGKLTTTEARDRVRELLPRRAGVELRIAQSSRRHGGGGIQIELSGDESSALERIGRQVADQLARVEGIQDVDLSLESGDDEILVAVERERALRAGVSSEAVARTIESSLSSRALSYLKTDDREVDLVMQNRDDERDSLGQLRNVQVYNSQRRNAQMRNAGVGLPLDALARFETRAGPRSIDRENRRPKVSLTANTTSPRATMRAQRGATMVMASQNLPPGYSWSFGRWTRMGQRDQEGSSFALLLALLLVYLLMAALFESWTHPFSIMAAVPFAFIGVGLVMKLADQPRDNFTELGFLILIGVVVNNAIVLIDHVNRLRQEGMPRGLAIRRGGEDRLRAIAMTAVTTVLGLAPMVAPVVFPQWFGPLEGRSATWAPVGLVILGGLTTSTFLTLLVVPTLYSLVDDLTRFTQRVARAL